MKRYNRADLFKMDAVEVYKLVLEGCVVKKFPDGYWRNGDSKKNATKCTKYLVEEILGYSDKELKENCTKEMFVKNKLGGMLQYYFKNSPYNAINNAYPGKFKEWEFKYVPMGYWRDKENAINAIKWMIEEKLKYSDKELKENLTYNTFRSYGLAGMMQHCFNNSPYNAINSAYPGKFKEWEFKYVPMYYWKNKENGVKATKWMIEEKLSLSEKEIKEKLSAKLFIDNGLHGMLHHCFNNSPYEAINYAYPNKYRKTDFKNYKKR